MHHVLPPPVGGAHFYKYYSNNVCVLEREDFDILLGGVVLGEENFCSPGGVSKIWGWEVELLFSIMKRDNNRATTKRRGRGPALDTE